MKWLFLSAVFVLACHPVTRTDAGVVMDYDTSACNCESDGNGQACYNWGMGWLCTPSCILDAGYAPDGSTVTTGYCSPPCTCVIDPKADGPVCESGGDLCEQ